LYASEYVRSAKILRIARCQREDDFYAHPYVFHPAAIETDRYEAVFEHKATNLSNRGTIDLGG